MEAIFVYSAREYPYSAMRCQGQSILMTTMLEEQMFITTKKPQKPSEALHVSEICKAYKSLINSEMNLTEMATEYLQTC